MIPYPLKFSVSAQSPSGIASVWSAQGAASLPPVPVAIPPEFNGPGGGYSPEDLFAMALQNCFIATFKVFAEKSQLAFDSIQVEALLEVDRTPEGKPWMARCHFDVTLKGAAAQREVAQRLLERTAQSCMVLNSVRTEKTFNWVIE